MSRMQLVGGSIVEDYDNRTCLRCGRPMKEEVVCRMTWGNICYTHCRSCPYFVAISQSCIYAKKKASDSESDAVPQHN